MLHALDTTLQDFRYAFRGFVRNPAFALTAILAAALGIGATSAVFSAVDRILFRPLPYANEDRLVSIGMLTPLDNNEFLLPDAYFDLKRDPGPLASVTAFQAGTLAVDLTESNPVRLRALRVDANFLNVFGIAPLIGRAFTDREDVPNGPRAVLISYGLWRSRFGADPNAAGRTISLDGTPVEVVGVLPKNFLTPTLVDADILLPLALNKATERSGRALRVFGRLKSGLSVRQAAAQLQPQFRRAIETVPAQFRKEISMRIRPVRDRQVGDARAASLALLGSVLAVLLIACANIASLLLARAVTREGELAVRIALGASRTRLARQAIAESLLLSAIGGAAGCVFAWMLLRVFVSLAPSALPRIEEAGIDARMLLFTVGAALLSGLLFGLAPALRRHARTIGPNRYSTPRLRSGLRPALVALEIAFSVVLLTGAALLLRSLWKLESLPLGMQTDRVLTARFVLGRQHYGRDEQQITFYNELEQRLQSVPGVQLAAIADTVPPAGGMRSRPLAAIEVEGQPPRSQGTGGTVGWRYVTPGYFAALGIPIVRGRPFTEQDRDPAAYAVILSESLARLMFPNQNPIGRRILKGPQGQWSTIVGIARDVANFGEKRESSPEYYIVRKHSPDFNFQNQEPPTGWRSGVVIARAAIDPALVAAGMRSAFQSLDPGLPVELETMRQRVRQLDERPRFYAILLASFAVIGVLIAAVGLGGLISFLTAQRSREIGVRMALGASPGVILRWTLASAAPWTAAGIAAGSAGSIVAARFLRALLFQVEPGDPRATAAAIAVLCLTALAAAALPAYRASRLDPMDALRQD